MPEQPDDPSSLLEPPERISGTYPVLPTANENSKPFLLQTPGELVKRRLDQLEIFQVRAQKRNDLRFWEEKHVWSSRFFGIPHLEEMTAGHIEAEQKIFHERIIRLLSREEKEVHPVRTLAFMESIEETDHNKQKMEREELAKYLGTKARKYIEMKKYSKARSILESGQAGIRLDNNVEPIHFVSRFVAADAIRDCFIHKDKGHLIDAIQELGAAATLDRSDFEDLPLHIVQNPEIQKLMAEWLSSLLKLQPKLYPLVRDYLDGLGFIHAREMDETPEIQHSVKQLLIKSMDEDVAVYGKFSDLLSNAGIITQEEANILPEIQERALKILIKNVTVSPDVYAAVRDDMAAIGLIDAQQMDEHPEIQKRLLGHLLNWEDVHPKLRGKFSFWWGRKGLMASTPEQLGISQSDAKKLVANGGSSFVTLNPAWYKHSSDHELARIFENEKNEAKGAVASIRSRQERILGQSQQFLDNEYFTFARKYRQFVLQQNKPKAPNARA